MNERDDLDLARALRRHAEEHLDQWDAYKWQSSHGPVWVLIRRQEIDGVPHWLELPSTLDGPDVNQRIRRLLDYNDELTDKIDELRQLLDLYHAAIPAHAEAEWLENLRGLQREAGLDPAE